MDLGGQLKDLPTYYCYFQIKTIKKDAPLNAYLSLSTCILSLAVSVPGAGLPACRTPVR
jgi:hypothetical protein